PRARRLAESRGLDWVVLYGTGPEGAIVERDVLSALAAGDNETVEVIPLAGARAVIAARMRQSAATTAPVTLTTEADAGGLVRWRRRLAAEGTVVSYNDLLLVLLGRALREHPRVNATLRGAEIHLLARVHVGLAVDAPAGLVAPVVRDVDHKGVEEIAAETEALVSAAREGKLAPESMRGGTFTLTNLGMFGIDAFTPVINLPECAILGVGRIKRQPVAIDDEIVIRDRVWLSLTFDHRLLDGGPAARFLQRVAQLVADPG
ncbi:MAG: odhB, partial [Armatimonadetes bacterium]|nr:odhB [Armatimonadota bacterium]